MRAFWIMVGLLVIGAAIISFRGGGERDNDTAAPAARPASADRSSDRHPNRLDDVAADDDASLPAAAREMKSAAVVAASPVPAASAGENEPADPGPDPADAAGDLVDDLLAGSSDPADAGVDAALAATPAELPAFNPDKPVDGKYIVAGSGAADDPYQITWDLLMLTAQTYQPRLGSTTIPPQVQAMDGAHIKIAGYFAVPMASTDAREVLVMLNMWDGCCIGLPPSPCDAIEVRLKEPLPGSGKQYINYGTLTGTLQVDPFVQNGWLLGMYLVEDGELEVGM
jgi:hypothetical protein